jgi:hypothetical protein
MSGIVTLARASVDQVAGPIAIPMAETVSGTILPHWIFDVDPTASAPAGARAQRRKPNTTANPLATNQTTLAHSTFPFTNTTLSDPIAGGVDTTPWTTAVKFPIGDAVHTPMRGCC